MLIGANTMTTLTIQINCDNDAFSESPETEVKRILETVVDNLSIYSFDDIPVLRDYNGNSVGFMEVTDDE
jgi:hypothetical protein